MRSWDHPGEYQWVESDTISSMVQAVVDWYGPTDFLHMNDETGDLDHFAYNSPESQLVGGPIREYHERAAAASPLTYAHLTFPPYLIIHGEADRTVLPNQSILLNEKLKKWWVQSDLMMLPGAGHGFEGQNYELAIQKVRTFLKKNLKERAFPSQYYYVCNNRTFSPDIRHKVRWLDLSSDWPQVKEFWPVPINEKMWKEAHQIGYQYAAAFENGQINSVAALLPYSEAAWELSAVHSRESTRGVGFSTSVCSFVTSAILKSGRLATVSTRIDNIPMQRTARKIGYVQVG